MKKTLLFICLILCISCRVKHNFSKNELTKVSDKEILIMAKKGILNPPNVIIKDPSGKIIQSDEMKNYDFEKYYCDRFKNGKNVVVEIVIRKKKKKDSKLIRKINFINTYGTCADSINNKIKVRCDNLDFILAELIDDDQKNRSNSNLFDFCLEIKNQNTLFRLIDKCGFPNLNNCKKESIESAFFIILHSDVIYQEKYRSAIIKSIERRDLDKSCIAYLDDKISITNNKYQIYGTQYYFDEIKNRNILYPIKDYKNINEKRQKVGLSLLEDFIKQIEKS